MRERWWSAICCYTGRSKFLFGSVRATGSEDARRALLVLWEKISPHLAPDSVEPQPGRLVIEEDGDGE